MKESIGYRIVVDTNIFISFLIGKILRDLPKYLHSKTIELVVSDELMNELIEVTARPKFSKHFSQELVGELLMLINERSVSIQPRHLVDICRDPKDNYLLALATAGKADLLITGDQDLLDIRKYGRTRIVPYKEFEKIMDSKK